jgi:hypothetical protein
MSDQEKSAWIQLSIILVTLAAYFIIISFVRFDSVSASIFAIAGFLGFRPKRRSGVVVYDERDREIERRALLTSMIVFYLLAIAFTVIAGSGFSDHSVPVWKICQMFWAATFVVWAIKAILIIVSYRRGANA